MKSAGNGHPVFRLGSVLALAAVVSGGCAAGEIDEPSGQVEGDDAAEARLLTTADHASGLRVDFYQYRDASLDVVQRGRHGVGVVALPESDDMVAIYRFVSPGQPVPEVLLQADRDYRHALANGLIGKAWLPPPPTKASSAAFEGIQQAATLGEPALDAEQFRAEVCRQQGSDPQWRCFVNSINNWEWSRSTLRFRLISLGMSTGAGGVEVTYQSCAIGIFCKKKISGVIQQGDIWHWQTGQQKSSVKYKVNAPGVIWHFSDHVDG